MNWQQVCEDPNLKDLPYKIELNERGQILMSPARLFHSAIQGEIIIILKHLLNQGKIFPECAISTSKGTKVADVVWCSQKLWEKIKHEAEASIAPEICIEVVSPTNTQEEMRGKKFLYLEQGANEVWISDEQGITKFFDSQGELEQSKLVPGFPQQIEV